MSITSGVFTWSETQTERAATHGAQLERFPTHSRVVLPDGAIMLVRVASLAAAKDLLAAQRAAARRLAAQRDARILDEVGRIAQGAERETTR